MDLIMNNSHSMLLLGFNSLSLPPTDWEVIFILQNYAADKGFRCLKFRLTALCNGMLRHTTPGCGSPGICGRRICGQSSGTLLPLRSLHHVFHMASNSVSVLRICRYVRCAS